MGEIESCRLSVGQSVLGAGRARLRGQGRRRWRRVLLNRARGRLRVDFGRRLVDGATMRGSSATVGVGLLCAIVLGAVRCAEASAQERTTVAPMRMPREIEARGRMTAPITVREEARPGAGADLERTVDAPSASPQRGSSSDAEPRNAGMPVDEERVSRLAAMLGRGFARYESASVVMLADTTGAMAHARLGSLEMARAEVARWGRRMDLDPVIEETKHVCVLFAERDAYVEFAAREDLLDASGLGGHYSPSKERIALYADPPGIAPSDGLRIRAMHEAAHMALFRTGLQTNRRTQPFWLSEGLASAFEPISGAPGAPDRERVGFREAYLAANQESRAPIAWLIEQDEPGAEEKERVQAMYRTSEALVRYLSRHRRGALTAYMDALRRSPPGPRTGEELRLEFRAHFGDPARIEREMALRPW